MTKAKDKELFNLNKRRIKSQLPTSPTCPYCNCIMVTDNSSPYALVSIDHIVAYSKNGTDDITNLIACCGNCNTKKGNNPRAIMFRLDSPQILSNNEYENLNDFITINTRITILENLKELVINKNYPEALQVILDSQVSTTSKSFFNKLEISLKNCLAVSDSKVRDDYCLKEIIVRLRSEKDKMSELKEATASIKFSTYCLVG